MKAEGKEFGTVTEFFFLIMELLVSILLNLRKSSKPISESRRCSIRWARTTLKENAILKSTCKTNKCHGKWASAPYLMKYNAIAFGFGVRWAAAGYACSEKLRRSSPSKLVIL